MRGFFRKALRETLRRLILREAQAPLSYITAGGDLHVTLDVMAQLGLPQGGGEGEDPWL